MNFMPSSNIATASHRSEFGQRLEYHNTFRVITDINKKNEMPSHNAGV